MNNKKVVGAVVVVVLALVGFFYGPTVAKSLSDAVAPIVSDVAPVDSAR
jgi:hypothetical protein